MKEKINVIQWVMKYKQITLFITGVLLLFGLYALFEMPRQEFPEFTVRQGLVIGVFPGASSEQVEAQLTSEVEKCLFSFKEVNRKKTYSISREGMMIVFVEVLGELDRTRTDAFWAKLKHGLNELKQQLPPEVIALIANNEFGDTSAILLTISSNTRSYKELEEYQDRLETELRKIEAVSNIRTFGEQDDQIGIYIDDAKLASYGIKPLTLLAALKTEGSVTYAGELDNGKRIMPIHIPPRYHTENDIASQIVYTDPQGNSIRLRDVATIKREYGDPDSYIRADGNRSLVLSLEMHFGHNIVNFGKQVDKVLNGFAETLPSDVKINKIADMPTVVNKSVTDFLIEFVTAIVAVIFVTMLLLPRRIASIAAITIPLSVIITLGILYIIGIELNTVSLAALIVVLGMVVDNSIVVIDNYVEKLDHGLPPRLNLQKNFKENING